MVVVVVVVSCWGKWLCGLEWFWQVVTTTPWAGRLQAADEAAAIRRSGLGLGWDASGRLDGYLSRVCDVVIGACKGWRTGNGLLCAVHSL